VWVRKAQKSKKQSPAPAQVRPVGNVQPVLLWPNIGTATWDKGWTSEKRGRYSATNNKSYTSKTIWERLKKIQKNMRYNLRNGDIG